MHNGKRKNNNNYYYTTKTTKLLQEKNKLRESKHLQKQQQETGCIAVGKS